MIAFGAPWALAAGVALAGAAILLHLFAPRPPARAPLPTARFLREDARTLVRPRRVPSDVPVLALRIAVALLLGALFAAPRWAPDREDGTTRIVLLDRGAGMDGVWEDALARAAAEAEGRPGSLVVPFDTAPGESLAAGGSDALGDSIAAGGSDPPGESIAAGGSDASERAGPTAAETGPSAAEVAGPSTAQVSGPTATEIAGPSDHESSYLVALRTLRRIALDETATTEVEVVLVSRPRWSAWDQQLAALRAAAWPGSIRVVDVAPPLEPLGGSGQDVSARPVAAAVPDPRGRHRPVAAALEVLGYQVVDAVAARAATASPDRTRSEGAGDVAAVAGDSAVRADPAVGADSAVAADPAAVPAVRLRFIDAGASSLRESMSRAADGDTVVVFGAARPTADAPELTGLWDQGAWPEPPSPVRTLRVGAATIALTGAEDRARGAAAAAAGRRLPIAWEDGAPAAGASSVGSGCLVRFGGPLDAGSADPDYPALIRALADGCRGAAGAGVRAATGRPGSAATTDPAARAMNTTATVEPRGASLDSAAIALLRGDGAESVAVASLGEPEGRSLEGWVLLAVALLALAETALVASRRRDGGVGSRRREAGLPRRAGQVVSSRRPGGAGSRRRPDGLAVRRGAAGFAAPRGVGAGP